MKTLKTHLLTIWKDESGQGMMEYILLLVAVVVLVAVFRGQITGFINNQLGELGNALGSFNSSGQ